MEKVKSIDLRCCGNCDRVYLYHDLYYCKNIGHELPLTNAVEIASCCPRWEWDGFVHSARKQG